MNEETATPFTSAAGATAGISSTRRAGPRYRRLHHGVHVEATAELDLVGSCRAALLALPDDAVFSRHTAARLWGGVVPHWPKLTATVPHRRSARRTTLDVVRARTMPERRRRRGLPVTGPERTFLDLAAVLPLVDLVVLGDSLVRRGVTTPGELARAAASHRGPRVALARRAAHLVRADVDSPMETRVRLLVVLAGLPEPAVNHILRHPGGDWRYRFDLSYPDLEIAIEYDGRQHAESTDQWVRDLARREALDRDGWRLVVLLSHDVFGTPGNTIERIRGALADRGCPVAAASDEWREHFPGRQVGVS